MKIKLTRTVVVEFEPDPSLYPEGFTLEEMAENECLSDIEDREWQFEDAESDVITYQIIE